ncbi:hypothetical protein [Candidatus Williamhamiltonella defendens]|uniref:hypothetical protein n=1 Tax=Candidatus Williamhamiltonella defendens TaxID=138072 RepID=UPI001F276C77|nr:hypothetical protein [Candidatus Hamiltonella defensa]
MNLSVTSSIKTKHLVLYSLIHSEIRQNPTDTSAIYHTDGDKTFEGFSRQRHGGEP